ncbi:S9 family peptidase [Halioglobus maricola]|uniref:prolyl oligopeptidase n=1 Tax=Halioglobus maricola TaxID=2601894 RepID=A0A5P9NLX7_9GAMM|nr:prolyl oligopeptidase family serine peptidase [Halioglobus maricola]QFU76787.1 S9 family peptidase [Halioglobus maricola]
MTSANQLFKSLALATFAAAVVSACSSTDKPAGPPVAKVDNVVDTHWGVTVQDPYRYMEDVDDPYVREWFEGQAGYAAGVLDSLPQADELFERIQQLDQGKPFTTHSVRRLANGDMFFMRRNADENIAKLYHQPAGATEARLLVDPESMAEDGEQHYSLEVFMPSWDGKYLAYGMAQGGSEETTYRVMDMASGDLVGEPISNIETAYNRPQWALDGSGYYYSRRRDLPADAPATEIYKKTVVRYHALGGEAAKDPVIAGYGLSTKLPLAEADFPSIVITPGSDHAVLKVKHGDSNEISIYTAPVNTLRSGDVPWQQVCSASDLVVDFAVAGSDIYMLTAEGAPRFKLVKTGLSQPDLASAAEVIPAGELVLDSIYAAADALYIDAKNDGVGILLQVDSDDRVKRLQAPGDGAAFVSSVSPQVPGILAYTVGWTTGGARYSYDPADDSFTDTGMIPKGEFDNLPGYVSHEVLVPGHDGEKIPLSIIHKKGLKLDGSNPTIVYGYGSYGISMDVRFSAVRLAWLERGGVYAIAHVRGGGEYGQAWHYAGRMQNKPNTWKDLIASAEYLVEKGYTSPEHMAPMGGSAGGILVGRSITERPDLFGAAVAQVGMLDAIRAETTTNGVPNIKEFGTVTEQSGFDGLYAMSAYHHVKPGVEYPAVLLTHGFNDRRVNPWMSGKMAAQLQASGSEKPVLLRVDFGSGHGIGSTRAQVLKEAADIYSFLFWQLGG